MQPVLQHHRPLTSMESRRLVGLMAKVQHGLIKFIYLSANVYSTLVFETFITTEGFSTSM